MTTHPATENESAVPRPACPKISIIVPTFNEKPNVDQLVERIAAVMRDVAWEVIFVDDDSPDQTAERVRDLAQSDARVRCIQRIERRGLSSACLEGMLSSSAPYLAVMDADLQHDERLLPDMLRTLETEDVEIVVGSRYTAGGSAGDWDERRVRLSRLSTWLAGIVLKAELSDPMSGFFAVRRDAFLKVAHNTSGVGFKILLDMFASANPPLRFRELPYEFRPRRVGESKLDNRVALDFITLLLQKKFGRLVPPRLVYFCLVGGTGVGVHLAVFSAAFHAMSLGFTASQSVATAAAMTGNFTLNNLITYRDRRLRGLAWLRGLFLFMLACSIGAVANVGIASYMFSGLNLWLPSVLAGLLVSTIWNYATTAFYVWRPGD